jgi:hypothetical protein
MNDTTPKSTPPKTPPPRVPQFGMRGLLLFTTGLCVLFGILAALRVGYLQMLIGFTATALFSLLVIVILEAYMHFDTRRRGRRECFQPSVASRDRPATTRWQANSPLPLPSPDPTGIDFVEPEGISYVEQADASSMSPEAPIEAQFADERSLDSNVALDQPSNDG